MYTYIEIINDATKEVITRMDVTKLSERAQERVWDGASINLNTNHYSLKWVESETELPKINQSK